MSGMGPDDYSEIGMLLKRARLDSKLSLEQASHALHIRTRYLDALESGRLTELPGLAYTKGYLQSYASFLGLDREELLRRFEQIEDLLAKRSFYFPQALSREKTPAPWAVWGGLSAALVAYLLWLLVFRPDYGPVSIIESYPNGESGKVSLSARSAQDVACLRASDVLYPPCHAEGARRFYLLPLPRQIVSVMELAEPSHE